MSEAAKLLKEIQAFCESFDIAPTTLCRKAVENSKLPQRIRDGGDVTFETAARIRRFMVKYRGKKRARAAA